MALPSSLLFLPLQRKTSLSLSSFLPRRNKKTKRREGKKRTLGGGGFSSFSSSSSLFLLFLFLLSSSSSSSFRRCTCVFDEKSFFTLIRIIYQPLVLFLCGSLVYFFLILLLIFFNWLNPLSQMRERFHFFKERFSPSFEEERKPCELLLARHIRPTSVIFRTQTHFYLHHTHKTCPRSPKSRTDASPSRL